MARRAVVAESAAGLRPVARAEGTREEARRGRYGAACTHRAGQGLAERFRNTGAP